MRPGGLLGAGNVALIFPQQALRVLVGAPAGRVGLRTGGDAGHRAADPRARPDSSEDLRLATHGRRRRRASRDAVSHRPRRASRRWHEPRRRSGGCDAGVTLRKPGHDIRTCWANRQAVTYPDLRTSCVPASRHANWPPSRAVVRCGSRHFPAQVVGRDHLARRPGRNAGAFARLARLYRGVRGTSLKGRERASGTDWQWLLTWGSCREQPG